MRLNRVISHPVRIAVGEWNVIYRTDLDRGIEEVYNLEDALMSALCISTRSFATLV